jgi:hypothetical protein
MTVININSSDPILNYLNENFENVVTTTQLHQGILPFGESVYKVENVSSEDFNNIFSANSNVSFTYDGLSFTTDNIVGLNSVVNYNASDYNGLFFFEQEMKTVYDITKNSSLNLYEKDLFMNPVESDLLSTRIKNTKMLSISPEFPYSELPYYKNNFPNYVNFDFYTNDKNHLLEILQEYGVYQKIISLLYRQGGIPVQKTTTEGFKEFQISDLMNLIPQIPSDSSWRDGFEDSYLYDLDTYLPDKDFLPIDGLSLMKRIEELKRSIGPTFSGFVNKSDSDRKVNSEILCYKILKFEEGETSNPIQTFYIPATEKMDNFVDCQVLFGKNYNYQIYPLIAVYCLQYKYNINNYAKNSQNDSYSLSLGVSEEPILLLYSFLMQEHTVQIQSSAPTPPDVLFYNQSSVEKKIKVYFEPQAHEIVEHFVPINDLDNEHQMHSIKNSDGKIVFKPSEQPISYEIFKLNHKPKSYNDFNGSLFMSVENRTPANSEVVEFFLTPNRKFYFLFRARNNFKMLSNPTPVYEIELIQDSDETRVVSRTIDFGEITEQRTKTFGKFVKIFPSFNQTFPLRLSQESGMSNSSALSVDDYVLGDVEHSIWGRKIKIRVRSKNTGKMIDLNVNFTLNKIQSEEDFS